MFADVKVVLVDVQNKCEHCSFELFSLLKDNSVLPTVTEV